MSIRLRGHSHGILMSVSPVNPITRLCRYVFVSLLVAHRVIPVPGCGLCSLSIDPIATVARVASISHIVAMPWNLRMCQSSTRLASFLPIPAAPRSRPAPRHKGVCETLRRNSANPYSLLAPVQASRYMALSTRTRATLPGERLNPFAAPAAAIQSHLVTTDVHPHITRKHAFHISIVSAQEMLSER
jgi:hypothetical protein